MIEYCQQLENCIVTAKKHCGKDFAMKRIKEKIETSTGVRWVTGTSKKEVEQRKRAIIEADLLQTLQPQVSTAPLFKAYAEAYMTRYKLRKIGANTMVGYRSYLTNHLYPAFGDLPIDNITVDRVQDFMLLEADNGSAKASINRIMQLLTQIMDSAVEDELIIKNPCKSKRLYNPSEKQQKVLPYSPGVYKQMERLLPLLPTDTDKLYLGLSMYAGLRQGEIVALRWEDVDFDLGFIHVRRAIQYAAKNVGTIKPPKTDNGVRDIPMMGQLRAILEALRKDEGFIICGQRQADKDLPMTQQMVRNMDIRVNKFFAEHGIKEPFKSHRMRHTVLTLLNNSRLADDKSLQAWAGHRDAAFTRRQYMTPQEEQLQTVGNGFSEYISSLL